MPWLGSGFLASGAAATDDVVEEAATPFDRRRHGMIVGMGAAALVVESADAARERGLQPICEVLGAVTANSAYHGTRLDVEHIGQVMESLVHQAETRGFSRQANAGQTMFVSHETYTPARGGSAAAEINALRHAFGAGAGQVVITNTKGFTGHAMGAGVEDVVAVKALETGIVPPVPNFKEPDPELGELNLSLGGAYPVRYALRLAAGFGSQIAMCLLRWTPVPDEKHRTPQELGYAYRIVDPATWQRWLDAVSGAPGARLEVVQRRLRVADLTAIQPPAPMAPPQSALPAEVEAPPEEQAAVQPVAQDDDVVAAVVEIVSGLTGYPPELLEVDLDLEADLGVDTVKQAEVFAAVRERFSVPRDENLRLRDFPTLAHVIGWIRERRGAAAHSATEAMAPQEKTESGVTRRVPVPALRPPLSLCAPTGVTLGEGSRVVLMPDGGGVGEALAARLRKRGVEVLALEPGLEAEVIVQRLGASEFDGVYWLAALDDEGPLDELDPARWHEALRRRVGTLYATMRHLYTRQPFLVTATRLGGFHGYDDAGATCPLGGAVTGFAKAYRKERPEALVKAVDFAPSRKPGRKPAALAELLVEETLSDPGCVEVGHPDGRRWGVALVDKPFAEGGGLTLSAQTTFLVTGAAGSIVSAIIADLTKACGGGVFHLLDVTPRPDPADAALRSFMRDREAFKVEVAQRLRQAGERPTPVLIDRELARLERLQAAQAAIDSVAAAGGKAYYHSVDLTDPVAVEKAVAEIRDASEHLDVLLHAAGLEISHALPDKEPHEFDLVFGVKAGGWGNLMYALRDVPIGVTVGFSSVAGRFGNAGQTDYSAANDLLCKVASSWRRSRPQTRAIVLDWTAWAGIGMATRGSIPKVMEAAGVQMLPAQIGIGWVRRELTSGASGEVVVAGELGQMAAEYHPKGGLAEGTLSGPFGGDLTASVHHGLTARVTLDPKALPFLDHHRIDGVAVLPGVMGIESFVELASHLVPESPVTAVEDVDFLAPVKFHRDEPRTLTITALVRQDGTDLVADCTLTAAQVLPGSAEPQHKLHFTGSVRFGRPNAEPQRVPVPEPGAGVGQDEVYRLYFHGPAYRVTGQVWGYHNGAAARFAEGLPAQSAQPVMAGPRLIELCFQTAGLWEAATQGRLALPRHAGKVTFVADPKETAGTVAMVQPRGEGFDATVIDGTGRVLLRLEDYRTIALPDPIDPEVLAPIQMVLTAQR
jgi:NAD(P)-dependent dehydrogenase (short-subunit alcohol dehydrogenase family)